MGSRGERGESYHLMMDKTSRAVHKKKELYNLHLIGSKEKYVLNGTEWPWKYLWAEVEKECLRITKKRGTESII